MRSVIVLFLLAMILGGAPVAAQQVSTTASFSSPVQLDLAAFTLTPSDLESLGLDGFGLANQSSLRDAEAEATIQSGGVNVNAAERLAVYREAGFRYRYVCSLLQPAMPLVRLPGGLIVAQQRISTAVTQYESAAGATFAFASPVEGATDTPGADTLSRTYGDESRVARSSGLEAETGEPFQRLELTFRLDAFVASVTIVDFKNVEPDLATIERLGERLLTKIEARREQQTPGLGPRTLRIAPLATWIERGRLRDFYVRYDNHSEPTFPELVAELRNQDATPEATPIVEFTGLKPQATYMFWTPIGDGDPLQIPLYVAWLDQYTDERQASAAVRDVATELGPGYIDVHELPASETSIGYDSRTFAYQFVAAPGETVRGYVVIARVGDTVMRIQADSRAGIRLAGLKSVAILQVACLQSTAACKPVESLQVLAALVPPPSAP